jgi:hypothetical protein
VAGGAESSRLPRDEGASLRLTAAALRLDQFTVRELSDSAQTNYETARDFVARRRDSGVFVPVDGAETGPSGGSVESSAPGRPAQRFTISDQQRSQTQKRLSAIQGSLANVAVGVPDSSTFFHTLSDQSMGFGRQGGSFAKVRPLSKVGSLAILERAVRALSNAEESPVEEREARIADIEILRRAADKDVAALRARGADPSSLQHFGQRLGAVAGQFEGLKQQRVKSGQPLVNWRRLIDELVMECRGYWAGGVATAKAIDRFVVLLDGIPQQQDAVTSKLLRSCMADAVSVASFPTATYDRKDWDRLRSLLHGVQTAAPSVVGAVFVAVDGSTQNASSTISEVSLFDKIKFTDDLVSSGSYVGLAMQQADKRSGGLFCLDMGREPALSKKCASVGINYVANASLVKE